MASIKSFRTVQHMQPFESSMSSSVDFSIRSPSIPADQNSFSTTAIFFPFEFLRIWLRSVVFPLQRKPVSIVIGIMVMSDNGYKMNDE